MSFLYRKQTTINPTELSGVIFAHETDHNKPEKNVSDQILRERPDLETPEEHSAIVPRYQISWLGRTWYIFCTGISGVPKTGES